MSAPLPLHVQVCEVVEIDADEPSSETIVRFHQGSVRNDYTISKNPDAVRAILGQYGWLEFDSGRDPVASNRYWILNRVPDPAGGMAIDDALPELQHP